MGKHLKKQFTTEEVIEILARYLAGEIGVSEGMALLKIQRRQFFNYVKVYREKGQDMSLSRRRQHPPHALTIESEQRILSELAEEKCLIDDPHNPVRTYNYSYVRSRLKEKHGIDVSLPSIITRAKKTVTTVRNQLKNIMTVKYSQTIQENFYSMTLPFICGRRWRLRNGI